MCHFAMSLPVLSPYTGTHCDFLTLFTGLNLPVTWLTQIKRMPTTNAPEGALDCEGSASEDKRIRQVYKS